METSGSGIFLSETEFRLICDYIRTECGIDLPDGKQYLIDARLSGILHEEKCRSYIELYERARNDHTKRLRDKIIDAITTNETLWFRDEKLWNAIRLELLPEFVKILRNNPNRKIKIWSAGCSTGQEPYSLAMLIQDALLGSNISSERFEITASDISNHAIALAEQGRYNRISMFRGMSSHFKNTYFKQDGNIWEICPEIKEMITFRHGNLLTDILREDFDLVFCRNVAIYFSEVFKKRLFANLTRVLKPGGVLVLGTSEVLSPYLEDYDSFESGVYFRLKPQGESK